MSEQGSNQNNRKKIILIASLSLLVIFPILALYMSSSGLKAYKSLKAEMKAYKDSVKIPQNNFISLKSSVSNLSQEIDKITVISFYDMNCKDCDSSLSEIKRIQQEFLKKTKRVHIKTYCINSDSISDIYNLITREKIDTTNWNFYTSNRDEMSSFVQQLKLNINECNNKLILADRKDVIVNYYNVNNKNEVNSLMKHATILLPAKEDRRKIKFKREKDIYQ
jgi:hypothetical protein